MDTENWMSNLPNKSKQLPLIHLAIPGSHDSMTSSISYRCKISPDAEGFLQNIKFLGAPLRLIMARWSKTQAYDLPRQLKAGVRYFDFRVATKPGSAQPYFVHGLYATDDVTGPLNDLNDFLNAHPNEVVILDFQHFYAFEKRDHDNFTKFLTATFNSKITPYSKSMGHLSLSSLTQSNHQVLIIYRDPMANRRSFWPSGSFPTPWPQTVSLPDLIEKLDRGIVKRSPEFGYVSQFVLTPTSWFVGRRLFSTLERQCVVPVLKERLEWVQKQKNGVNGVNVVISDFIELNDAEFTEEIIRINLRSAGYEGRVSS